MKKMTGREAYGDDHIVDPHVVDLEVAGAFLKLWGPFALKMGWYAKNIRTQPARLVDVEYHPGLIN